MLWLIKKLVFGHVHSWETTREVKLDQMCEGGLAATGSRIHLRCKKCGWVRKRDLI